MPDVIADSEKTCHTLVDLLRYRAAINPQQLAYAFVADQRSDAVLTYSALDERARAVAAQLQADGFAGQRALLLYRPGLEYIIALFGILYAGCIPVRLYPPRPNRPAQGFQAIVDDAQAAVALAPAASTPVFKRQLAPVAASDGLAWRSVETPPLSAASAWTPPAGNAEDVALLQYTSGSTSAPKGVMVSHDNILHNLEVINRNFAIGPDDIGVFWLPMYHDMGLIGAILEPMYAGVPSHLMAPVSFLHRPLRWLEAISRLRGTISGAPNFAYDLTADRVSAAEREKLDLSTWRLAFCGGEPIRCATLERFAETFASCGFRRDALYPCYGLAESTLMVSGNVPSATLVVEAVDRDALAKDRVVAADRAADPQRLVGCGRAAPKHTVAIVNPATRVGCEPDAIGELWISGPSVALGYWRQPDATKASFGAYRADTGEGPFMRTGDLGFVRHDQLFVTGRLKDLIVIRGRNHYPQDLELSTAAAHEALVDGACAAFPVDEDGEERLVVVQEIERRWPAAAMGEVVTAIRRSLSETHDIQPWAIALVKVAGVPKTSSGKIRRRACRSAFLAGELPVVHEFRAEGDSIVASHLSPSNVPADTFAELPAVLRSSEGLPLRSQQERLIAYFRSAAARVPALKGAQVAELQQPLTDLGLDSVTMVEFAYALGQSLGRPLPPTLLLDYATLDALTKFLLNGADSHAQTSLPSMASGVEERQARAAQIAAYSDEDVEALLLQKLKTLESSARRSTGD